MFTQSQWQFQFIGRQSVYLKKRGAAIAHPGTYDSPTDSAAVSVSVCSRGAAAKRFHPKNSRI